MASGIIALLLMAMMSTLVQAQSFYGSMVGTVADATGTVIADVPLTLTNIGTNEKHTVKTDATGNYRFVNLVPANYKLEAELTGFKHMSREPIVVQVGSAVRIDAVLEVGSVSETVEVAARTPLLQTESATVGQVVEGAQVQETPLNGRNVMNLIALTPGVVPQTGSQGSLGMNTNGHTNINNWGGYQIGGGAVGQNAMFYDGAPTTGFGGNIVTFVPTQDAVQEFKVDTNGASSEFGRYGGGVINMTSKSGSNALHGSFYEYFRNNVLNANDFASKMNGKKRGQWNQNQYGVTASGPFIKDKLFGFLSWEGFSSRTTNPATMTVPWNEIRSGIFRTTLKTDNLAAQTLVSNGCITPNLSDAKGAYWKVNDGCKDFTAQQIQNFYALPTSTGTPAGTGYTNNYYVNPSVGSDSNQYIGRVDYQLNQNQRFFGRYSYFTMDDIPQNLMNNAGGFKTANSTSHFRMHQTSLGDTYTLNSSSILDVRLSYTRAYYDQVPIALNQVDMSKFDGAGSTAWATLSKSMSYREYPLVTLSSTYNIRGLGATDMIAINTNNTYTLAASMTKILSRHSLKVGGAIWMMDNIGINQFNSASGSFTFSGSNYTGNDYANFLIGIPSSATLVTTAPPASYNYYQGYFANDNWQASKKLTFDLGLRWELPGGLMEKRDKASVLLPDVADPTNSARKGTLALVNSPLRSSRSMLDIKHDLFAVHAGATYRAGANTVVRAGYGISYLPIDMLAGSLATGSTVNSFANIFSNGTLSTTALSSLTRLSNPYPGGLQNKFGRDFTMANVANNPASATLSSPVPTFSFPNVQQWNVGLSHQFAGDVMFDVSYVGAKGTHTPITTFNMNQVPDTAVATMQTMSGDAAIQTYGYAQRPNPAYLKLLNTAAFRGGSNYQSLQSRFEKRFKGAGVLMANYTWAKSLSDADGALQDYSNLHNDKSLAGYDAPHRGVVNYVVKLPFGKGQKFGSSLNGPAGKLVSGWALNGITTWQKGTPLAISWNGGNNLSKNFGAGTIRPNLSAGCTPKLTGGSASALVIAGKPWMTTTCTDGSTKMFVTPGNYGFGNESRTDGRIRSHGTANFDFAVLKSTSIKEKVDAQFRMEFFNVFNRTQFAAPNVYADNGSFGIVPTSPANRPRLIQASLRLNF